MEQRDKRQKLEQEITKLEACLAELEARLPAHSVPPAMLMEIEELEDRLADVRAQMADIVASEQEARGL